ncbi:MAG: TIGR00282 family metallophosphoesterase [Spirochaetales bacterium]|nr:TIGR00282 family metallophosphoesterase [Spirochaetales bacterium]
MNVLYLGDVVGPSGMRALTTSLPSLRQQYSLDFVAVNGENATRGFGLRPDDMHRLFHCGVDLISSGNHIWQREELRSSFSENIPLLRPANYPSGAPGRGHYLLSSAKGMLAIVNLQGRERMGMAVDCPFQTAEELIRQIRHQTQCILVDFHAEDVREKEALFALLDGQVSGVLGTHTHVQTVDARVLSGGTAVMTDLGMCGPIKSVIGTKPELSLRRSLTQLPLQMEVSENPAMLCGALLEIDPDTGHALSITRFCQMPGEENL